MKNSNQTNKQADLWFARGLTAQDRGDPKEAANAYKKVLTLKPNHLKAIYNLAILNHDLGNLEPARYGYLKAIELQPTLAEAYKNLADLDFNQKDTVGAIHSYKKALICNPQYPEAWHNSGLALRQLNQLDDAFHAYCEAIKLRPDYSSAIKSLPAIAQQTGKTAEAALLLTETASADPENIEIRLGLAEIFLQSNKIEELLVLLQEISAIDPQSSEAFNLSGLIELQMGNVDKALDLITAAHKLNPLSARIHSNLLYALIMDPQTTPTIYKQIANSWWQQQGSPARKSKTYKYNRHKNAPPLRLGFISADFYRHSVSYFLLPLIRNLNPDKFRIYCYSDTCKTDIYTTEIKKHTTLWHSIYGLDHQIVGDLINKDQIDILVELSGHTSNNRLPVIAQQPAPLQFSWLGYPASSGIPSGTYRLTDKIVDPEENRSHYSEPLAYLPHIFLCYAPQPEVAVLTTTKKYQNQEIIFASFNNPAKTNQKVIKIWASILKAVPNAKLMLKNRLLNNKTIISNFAKKFLIAGIKPQRLIFHPGNHEVIDHFANYNQVDIALDTFPYNGTTTTCEALWMGVPVLTLRGSTHAARVGITLMQTIGHPELIAENEIDYIKKAISLSQSRKNLDLYKENLRQDLQNSLLMNEVRFASDFSATLEKIWNQNYPDREIYIPPQSTSQVKIKNTDPDKKVFKLLQSAAAIHQREELNRAADLYRKILDEFPKTPDALHLLGVIAHQQGNHQQALKLINQALQLNPKAAPFHFNSGEAQYALENYNEAETNYQKALNFQPDYPEAWSRLALVHHKQKDFSSARNAYEKALNQRPDCPTTLNNFGLLQFEDNKLDSAIELFHKALQVQPDYPEACHNLAVTLQQIGNVDEALIFYEKTLQLSPNHPGAHRQFIRLLQTTCSWSRLTSALQQLAERTRQSLNNQQQPEESPFLHITHSYNLRENQAIAHNWCQNMEIKSENLNRQNNVNDTTLYIRR